MQDLVAVVHCSRVPGNVDRKFNYVGYGTCLAANLAFAGPMDCQYACEGFGDCARVCPVDAITMVNNFPVIDPDECIACGACVKACPKEIIRLIPRSSRVFIPCSTKDSPKTTMAVCDVGCIHDKACVRKCPAGAISEEDGVIVVNQEKCLEYGPECEEVCIETCKKRHILKPFSLHETYKELAEKKAA